MAAVLSIWLSYLNVLIKPVSNVNTAQEISENEFWAIMKNGLNIVGGQAKNKINNFISKIRSGSEITIER